MALVLPFVGNADAREKRAGDLVVASYNIRHGRGMDGKIDLPRIADVLRKLDADLIALQEVDKNTKRTGGLDVAAELAKLLDMKHRFGPRMPYSGGEYGLAVLSRFPIKGEHNHLLSKSGKEPINALEVQVAAPSLPGGKLSFVSIHHTHNSQELRFAETGYLLQYLSPNKHSMILAGDFNFEPNNYAMQLYKDNGWSVLDKKGAFTFPSDKPDREIDYIMTKYFPAKVVMHEVIDERMASDHRPIVAHFRLQPVKNRDE